MDQLINTFAVAALTVFIFMSLWYIYSLIVKDASIVDIAWGIGFIVINVVTLIYNGTLTAENQIVLILVSIWGARLALHIAIRRWGRPEDFRYANWRREWGDSFIVRSFLQVFMLQGFLMLLISTPILLVNTYSLGENLNGLQYLGIAIWIFGFFWEAVGDLQLMIFKNNPENKGKIMKTGLWKFTRHPNYFGEAVLWWGIALIALSVDYGAIGLIGPILINFLLLKVSGVPKLEEKYIGNAEFEEYKKRTNAFVPWIPKG